MRKLFLAIILLVLTMPVVSCGGNLQTSVSRFGSLNPDDITEEITKRSERIAGHIKQLPYIENATATIIGGRALVAVDLDRNYKDDLLKKMKAEVKRETLLFDVTLKDAAVSLVPHLIDRATDFAGESENTEHFISDKLEEISVPTVPSI